MANKRRIAVVTAAMLAEIPELTTDYQFSCGDILVEEGGIPVRKSFKELIGHVSPRAHGSRSPQATQ